MFVDTQGTSDPLCSGLGSRWPLAYIEPGAGAAHDLIKAEAEPDRTAEIRRLSRRIMAFLHYCHVPTSPIADVAMQAAVVKNVTALLSTGERDEVVIFEQVLRTIGGGEIMPLLRSRLQQGAPSYPFAESF